MLVIFLLHNDVGNSITECTLRSLSVSQSMTGVKVQGKPEWSVSITNTCPCAQRMVYLNCTDFQTSEPITPSVLTVSPNGICILNSGQPIVYNSPFRFKYAWDHSSALIPISSLIDCYKM